MPTKTCPICGEEVQNLQFKKHMATHGDQPKEEKEQVKPSMKSEADKPSLPDRVDPELAILMKQALAVEEKMLDAPDLFFSEDSADQHAALAQVHCPESLGEAAEWKTVFGDARKRLDGYAAKGYRPVFDERGNMVRDEGGNPMFKVRKEIYEGRKDVYRKEDESRLHNVTKQATRDNPSSFSEEELTIEKN